MDLSERGWTGGGSNGIAWYGDGLPGVRIHAAARSEFTTACHSDHGSTRVESSPSWRLCGLADAGMRHRLDSHRVIERTETKIQTTETQKTQRMSLKYEGRESKPHIDKAEPTAFVMSNFNTLTSYFVLRPSHFDLHTSSSTFASPCLYVSVVCSEWI